MVFIGIDVAKDKHNMFAVDSDGVSFAIILLSQILLKGLHSFDSLLLVGAK